MARNVLSFLQQRYLFTAIGIVLALIALLTPLWNVQVPVEFIGWLLIWAGVLEIFHGFRRAEEWSRFSAWFSGTISLLAGVLLVNAILFQQRAIINFLMFIFFCDAVRYLYQYFKGRKKGLTTRFTLISGIGNLLVVVIIMFFSGKNLIWLSSLAAALRIGGIVFNLYTARMGQVQEVGADTVAAMGMTGNAELEALAEKLEAESKTRAPIDAAWIWLFIAILFFIHLGRMGFDRSRLGVLSPVVAVLGDLVIALFVAFAVIAPIRALFRRVSSIAGRGLWTWVQQKPAAERKFFSLRGITERFLTRQMRLSISIRKSSYSLLTACRNGLRIGLPFAALLAAIMPVLGMSWYFDTENWAAGIWDGWAATRSDKWREVMLQGTGKEYGPNAYHLTPPGLNNQDDFSFIIVGDTGEGDPSQLILKDQLQSVAGQDRVRFVVVSSDVIYPSGALKDYERKFFLPFKGVQKPIVAIPGNHDWYDALEGFVAVFYREEKARQAIRARIDGDFGLKLGTKEKVEKMLNTANFLRREYSVPTGYQSAPFFQVATDDFVLLTVDTGVKRQVDSVQLNWIRSVLEASKGKFVMALLGHPFYAIGEYQGHMNPAFHELHQLFRSYKVPLIMAGDTHDLEYYKEPAQGGDNHVMHHFVNGGGGAYLSIGAAMAPPEERPVADWANYPARVPLMAKIDSLTPGWKHPAWVWTKKYKGYPFSPEWLSAAFDYNQAPFFQSFVEVLVEKSQRRIRLIPYGNKGRLRWSDFDLGGQLLKQTAGEDAFAEWVIPMTP